MGRRKTLRSNKFPYHVVARSHNKVWFPLPIREMWEIYLSILEKVVRDFNVKIYAFTLMNNHFHLMLETPQANIDEVMYSIMKLSTLEVQKRAGVSNSIYGGRYKSSLLTKASYRANTYKYILRNPVKANLVSEVQIYPYSTCSLFGNEVRFKAFELVDLFAFDLYRINEILEWLNNSFNVDEDKSISQGLLRPDFRYGKDARNKIVEPEIVHPKYDKYELLWEEIVPAQTPNSNQISLF